MKIYTRGGDKGTTSLVGGARVSKGDLRVEAYGDVDELMAHLGVLLTMPETSFCRTTLERIQRELMVCSSHIATVEVSVRAKLPPVKAEEVSFLEREIDALQEGLPPIRYFVLPGGSHMCVAQTHVVRTVTRRAERSLARLEDNEIPAEVAAYLNRLSDYFFALGRQLAYRLNDTQLEWIP